jgi:tRNA A37 methylthiotransferase MiaB
VEIKVIKERSKILRKLDTELSFQFRSQFVGETAEILIENNNGKISGRSERYFMVHLQNPPKSITRNRIIKVRLTKNLKSAMTATI